MNPFRHSLARGTSMRNSLSSSGGNFCLFYNPRLRGLRCQRLLLTRQRRFLCLLPGLGAAVVIAIIGAFILDPGLAA